MEKQFEQNNWNMVSEVGIDLQIKGKSLTKTTVKTH